MQTAKHIYFFNYNTAENELCKLESKYIFDQEEKDKILFSDLKTDPSRSAYIKKRLDVVARSMDYDDLIRQVEEANISAEGFKVEYILLDGDESRYNERLDKLRDIGYRINGLPEYHKPLVVYALCYWEGVWYCGQLIKNTFEWHNHHKKPYSYSNSININIAKALVNIAAKNDNTRRLLDACCGVGTIMLEACFAGFQIEGCDINWKVVRQSRENLAHFNYTATVHRSDIKDLSEQYDTAIVDLPYNLLSEADENTVMHIITSASQRASQLLIVSATDISEWITNAGLQVEDHCEVKKLGKSGFAREVWVCKRA